jgi:hypothetical protein
MATSKQKVTLSPVLPSDYPAIARLEATAFWDDDYSTVAFGPLHARASDEVIAGRAKTLAAEPRPGVRQRGVKAVVVGPEGEEQIVGFASWGFMVGRGGADEEKAKEERALEEKALEDEKRSFAPGANVKLFEDSILKGDEHMERSTEGRDYASELILSSMDLVLRGPLKSGTDIVIRVMDAYRRYSVPAERHWKYVAGRWITRG